MLQITPHHPFFLGIEPLDFRKGIDAIAAYCKQRLISLLLLFTWHKISLKPLWNKSRQVIYPNLRNGI